MTPLEIQSLTKWYHSVRGIEDVSFDIHQGEIFGYLGPNGSGKTTTIRCIMGLLKPSNGSVRVFGKQVRHGMATGHNRIGYLPGDFRILGALKGEPALDVLASLGDGGKAKNKRLELAERLGLNLKRRIWTLSKGNRQKVGIIYAFQHEPEILILDEPTSGLDPLISQVVLDLIREAAEKGATILLSSHDLAEVSAVCGRAAILRQGRMVELSRISDIVSERESQLKIWFVEKTDVPEVPAKQLSGVRQIERNGLMIHIAYHGRIDAVLKWLAQYPVSRIKTHETSLEEAFMQYYDMTADKNEGKQS